jgi:hypothetical protein
MDHVHNSLVRFHFSGQVSAESLLFLGGRQLSKYEEVNDFFIVVFPEEFVDRIVTVLNITTFTITVTRPDMSAAR